MVYRSYVVLLIAVVIGNSDGYREYLNRLPNSNRVPCGNVCDTTQVPYCEAFGHTSCTFNPSGNNDFGKDFKDSGKTRGRNGTSSLSEYWTPSFCMLDSDGDGKSNGDELGDPCCVWNMGDPIDQSLDISHPSDPTSVTPRPSCSLAGAPVAPSGVAVIAGKQKVEVSWYTNSSSCVCTYQVTVTGLNTTTVLQYVSKTQVPVVLCGLPASSVLFIKVQGVNLAGISVGTTVNVTTLATPNNIDQMNCTVTTKPVPAGTVILSVGPSTDFGLIAVLVVAAIVVVMGLIITCVPDPSWIRSWFHHRSILPTPKDSIMAYVLGGFCELSMAQLVSVLLAILAFVLWFVQYFQTYDAEIYLFGKYAWERAYGQVVVLNMALVILPISRYSLILSPIFGIGYERALKFHKWLARLFVVNMSIHGVAMIVEYSQNSTWGGSYVLRWSNTQNVQSTLAAIICWGIFLAMAATAMIRSEMFKTFWIIHFSFIIGIVFAYLHTSGVLGPIVTSLILYGLDVLILLCDFFMRPTKVINAKTITDGKESFVSITFSKKNFTFQPGSFVLMMCPRVSYLPHPVSIATPPSNWKGRSWLPINFFREPDPQPFTCYIKATDNSRGWTSALLNEIQSNEISAPIKLSGCFGMPSIHYENYSYLVLVGGGIGITPLASVFGYLKNKTSRTTRQKVVLCWSFRCVPLYQDMKDNLTDSLRSPISSPPSDDHQVLVSSAKSSMDKPYEMRLHCTSTFDQALFPELQSGRPDYGALLSDIAASLPSNSIHIGVMSCGPTSMVQSLSDAIAAVRKTHNVHIDHHTECFSF